MAAQPPPFISIVPAQIRRVFHDLDLDDDDLMALTAAANDCREDNNELGEDDVSIIRSVKHAIPYLGGHHEDIVRIRDEVRRAFKQRVRMGVPPPPKKMEGGNFRNLKTRGVRDKIVRGRGVYDFTKMAHRKFLKHAAVPLFDTLATVLPLAFGQPELVPVALAAAHGGVSATKEAFLPYLGKNKKREAKLQTQQQEQEEEDALMNKYKISGKGIMNQPRSRSVGSDMLSPMAAATMGHSQAMNMKLKLEKDMAMGRRKQMGLVGVSGNLLGPGHIPALQSQPQQNFQFRHTITGAAYHPHVYGNGLYA
jgi:hypothetical protein